MLEHEMDPAKLRGSPLGWYFTLFFLIQGFMPVGFAIGIASGRESLLSAIAIVTAGGLLSAVAVTMLVRAALRAKKRVQHFEEARGGRRAQAQVLGVEYIGQAGTVKSGRTRRSYEKLRVNVRAWFEDGIPFELSGEACYTSTEKGLLEMNPIVSISLHPSGHGPFLVHPESIVPPQATFAPPIEMRSGGAHQQGGVQIQRTADRNRRW